MKLLFHPGQPVDDFTLDASLQKQQRPSGSIVSGSTLGSGKKPGTGSGHCPGLNPAAAGTAQGHHQTVDRTDASASPGCAVDGTEPFDGLSAFAPSRSYRTIGRRAG